MKYFSEKLYEMFDTVDELKAAEKKFDEATGRYQISRTEAYKATLDIITAIDAKSVAVEKKIVDLTNNVKSAIAERAAKGMSDFVAELNYRMAAKELAGVQELRDDLAQEYREAIEKLCEMRSIDDILWESELEGDDDNDSYYDDCCGDCDECDHYDTCGYDDDDEFDDSEYEEGCDCECDCDECPYVYHD